MQIMGKFRIQRLFAIALGIIGNKTVSKVKRMEKEYRGEGE